jgi:hypothetical protein
MTKAEASVLIDRPTEAVWSFLISDRFSKAADPNVIESKKTSAGPWGVGTTTRDVSSKFPKVMDFRITEYEPNNKATVLVTSGPVKGSVVTEKLENIEGKTKLTEIADFHLSGFYKLLQPFVDRPGKAQKETQDRVDKVKRAIESEVRP